MAHKLPSLQYGYNALEPYIDSKTMEIHHTKHHQGYVDKLNNALKDFSELQEKPIQELLKNPQNLPDSIRQAVINFGGGHANHSFFWKCLTPNKNEPKGKIAEAITTAFTNFENFKQQFTQQASTLFGSGWTWLVLNNGNLEIISTKDQDSPLSEGKTPLLVIDLWEHGYYLKYQNRRPEYIESFFNIINWEEVNKRFEQG